MRGAPAGDAADHRPPGRLRWGGYAQTAGAFLAILVVWQLVGLKVPRYLLPTPLATGWELVARAPLLGQHALITLREIVLGFALATLVSVPCALAVAFNEFLP